jgi:spermidine synthase
MRPPCQPLHGLVLLYVRFTPISSRMSARIPLYVLVAAILVSIRLLLVRANRKGLPFLSADSTEHYPWSVSQLLLASFLTLFAELAFIRWIAVEVRIFAYFKNLALLLCFLGFGLGCALSKKPLRWLIALESLLGLLLVIRLPSTNGKFLEGLSQSLGGASDLAIWATRAGWNWGNFLIGALLAGSLFLLLLGVFVPLGQTVSRQMDTAPSPLSAYSWNLLGSLIGILAFLGVSRMMLPPWVWLGAVLVGFAFLQNTRRDTVLVLSLLIPLGLLLHDPSNRDHYSFWTPYQQIDYRRLYMPDGELRGGEIQVNHTGYQWIANMSPDFLARHSTAMKEAADENPYNLPFRFAKPSPKVLIVGSGAGNDVAAALRHNSTVDAVEIDPAILALGRREHPEHPYASPDVTATLTDARAFLKRTSKRYDLILFGLLDSHTQFSDYSNMRIDNFVYTEESFEEAKAHLQPDGVLFVKFQVDYPWMSRRFADMLQHTFGKPALIFRAPSSYTAGATCFAISPSRRVEEALVSDSRLEQFVHRGAVTLQENAVPRTTDDWPYLYQEGRWIPRTYLGVGVIVILIAIVLYLEIPETRRQPPSLFFFSMGAGFLLLETQVISRLALYFGTTWQVNGFVIAALLIALLAANLIVEYYSRFIKRGWLLFVLLIGLLGVYLLPASRLPQDPTLAGILLALMFSVPVFFAGMLFSLEFRKAASPSSALGANILGAVAGGLLENLSLLFGIRALLLVTIVLYCLAGLAFFTRQMALTRANA